MKGIFLLIIVGVFIPLVFSEDPKINEEEDNGDEDDEFGISIDDEDVDLKEIILQALEETVDNIGDIFDFIKVGDDEEGEKKVKGKKAKFKILGGDNPLNQFFMNDRTVSSTPESERELEVLTTAHEIIQFDVIGAIDDVENEDLEATTSELRDILSKKLSGIKSDIKIIDLTKKFKLNDRTEDDSEIQVNEDEEVEGTHEVQEEETKDSQSEETSGIPPGYSEQPETENEEEDSEEGEGEEDVKSVEDSVTEAVRSVVNKYNRKANAVTEAEQLYLKLENGKISSEEAVKNLSALTNVTGTAHYFLGIIRMLKSFGQYDYEAAKRHFMFSAINGTANGQFKLAMYIRNGIITFDDLFDFQEEFNQPDPTEPSESTKSTQETEEEGSEDSSSEETEEEQQEKPRVMFFHPSLTREEARRIYDPEVVSLTYLFFSSQSGYWKALTSLAYLHEHGVKVQKNCQASGLYYLRAAEIVMRSVLEESQIGSTNQKPKLIGDKNAIKELQKESSILDFIHYSANRGDAQSQLMLGYSHMFGLRGMARNPEMARDLFEQAIEGGQADAHYPLGIMYTKGIGVDQDNDTARQYFEKGAAAGDSQSQNGLGFLYLNGAGVKRDPAKAFHFFNMSASQGSPEGMYNLALLYLKGLGTPRNEQKAFHYFHQASNNGQIMADRYLGEMYFKGMGGPKKCVSATHHFKKFFSRVMWMLLGEDAFRVFHVDGMAWDSMMDFMEMAEMGDVSSQVNVAYIVDRGHVSNDKFHVSEEEDQSAKEFLCLENYKRASDQGDVRSQMKVGDFYYYGRNTEINYEKSVEYYRLALRVNNAQAAYNMGYMHEMGLGVERDFFLAKRNYDSVLTFNHKAYLAMGLVYAKLYAKWGLDMLIWSVLGAKDKEGHCQTVKESIVEWGNDRKFLVISFLVLLLFLLISVTLITQVTDFFEIDDDDDVDDMEVIEEFEVREDGGEDDSDEEEEEEEGEDEDDEDSDDENEEEKDEESKKED